MNNEDKPLPLTDEEWVQLLDGGSDDSQLPMCCANISTLRDTLGSIIRQGRHKPVMSYELRNLKQHLTWAVSGHDIEHIPAIAKLIEFVGGVDEEHTPTPLEL